MLATSLGMSSEQREGEMFQFRVEQHGEGHPRLMQRTVLPDGESTVLTVDFSDDFNRLNTFGPNVSATGLYQIGFPRGEGTGADATDENGNAIPYTLEQSGDTVTWMFASAPKDVFWVWVTFTCEVRAVSRV
jgi:hypothetical protein